MNAVKKILVTALILLPMHLSATESDSSSVKIQWKMRPTITAAGTETGMILITLSNTADHSFPGDTLQLHAGTSMKLETSMIPFDSIGAGESISLMMPYNRSTSANSESVFSASLIRTPAEKKSAAN